MSGLGQQRMENIREHSQKGGDVQKRLNETTELHEQQQNNLRLIIPDLQTKLMEVQLERDGLQDTRRGESQSQENAKLQLKNATQELEAARQLPEEILREADSQTQRLEEMVHSQEEVLVELRGIVMDHGDCTGKKLSEHGNVTGLHIHSLSAAFAAILQDLDSEVSFLKEKVVLVEEELESLRKDSQTLSQLLLHQHQNGIEQLISEREQEVAAPASAGSYADSIQNQMEIMQDQTRTQNSVHAHQAGPLESAVSQLCSELREAKRMYEDKVEDLKKQLHVAHSEIAEAVIANYNQIQQLLAEPHKKEIELSLEKEQNKQFWDQNTDVSISIDHLRRELDNKTRQLQRVENTVKEMRAECQGQMERQMAAIKEKNESLRRISSLTVQLESTKETLCKAKEDLAAKQVDLETAEKTVSDLTACLQEKESALEVTSKEVRELHSQLGSSVQELQHLKEEEENIRHVQSECETLKLQVLEKERVINIFQKQVDNMTQIVGQHGRTAGAMEVEKFQLIKEINDWKLEVRELKIAKDEKEARIHEMETKLSKLEVEKVKLVNTCTERLRALHDMKLEKAQLVNEVRASQSKLAGLAEGFQDLKRNYQKKIKEMEKTANRWKMLLKSAQAELEQTRTALKTMEGTDGRAVKVAVGMQKQITARRGQIDALQSKIKFLEEAMANAAKEKHNLREENSKLSQELSCVTAENTKIAGELEVLRSQDKRLKERISRLETALDKVSVQFAECQCIIQRQEQEAMRFRLQHTLDLKELQGPGLSSASAPAKLWHRVPLAHLRSAVVPPSLNLLSCAPRMSSKASILKEEPLQALKKMFEELRSSSNDIPTVDHGKNDGNGGRKSPAATKGNTVEAAAKDSATETIVEKDTFGRDPSCLHTADLQSQRVTLRFTSPGGPSIISASPCCTSFPTKVSQEERYRARSPVHALLTAPLADLAARASSSPEHRPSVRKCGSPEGAAAVPQMASQPTDTTENVPRRLQNKKESLLNLVESLQMEKQALSSMIRTQEMKTEKAKEKEKKLSK
ncbi:PREDICTED: coiled-coil domain-containing protein 158 [Mesitornis unicolor]|uniref:coiled-coil domain-containing protein 158 n=1 Tax=Mesitornis unicolor TaxID=54374 RepID=UPI0005290C12|nr:PREDICTED: coiled-coil domain-containing protein 158 [Mesitornis unicolor]